MLIFVAGLVFLALLAGAAWVVFREASVTTEVEAAPGYSLVSAMEFVRGRLDSENELRNRQADCDRLVTYCVGVLETAGIAFSRDRFTGEELGDADLVLDVAGLARAMADGTGIEAEPVDLEDLAGAFLEYLSEIGAVGDAAEPG